MGRGHGIRESVEDHADEAVNYDRMGERFAPDEADSAARSLVPYGFGYDSHVGGPWSAGGQSGYQRQSEPGADKL